MKKIIAASINLFSIVLLFVSISILTLRDADTGSALMYIQAPDYVSSAYFENQAKQSITDIFDYITLTSIFEKDGKLNLNQVFAQANVDSSSVSYSLEYLIQYARSMGYYFNNDNELVGGGPSTISRQDDELNHQIIVRYRAYMPDYVQTSPTDGMMSLGQLAQEALEYLSRYYKIKNEFDNPPGNFHFRVTYVNPRGETTTYTNSPSMSESAICELGRYAYTDSRDLKIDTNMASLPSDLVALLQNRNPYDGDANYHFSCGIDTTFPKKDFFQHSAKEYDSLRQSSIVGVILLVLSIVSALGSLILLIVYTGHSNDRTDKKIYLYSMDHIPFECLIALFVLWSFIAGKVTPAFLDSVERILGELTEYDFWRDCISFSLKYLMFIPFMLSLIRTYKADQLYKASLLHKFITITRHYILCAERTASRAFSYTLFILPNVLALCLITVLFVHFFEAQSLNAFLSAIMILLIILAIDLYTWRISTGLNEAVNEQVKSERLKADLITNVSHDLKTPLTSIISYVDLMKREDIQNPRVIEYLSVLEQKSTRLKTLTEDLVEASKASSGNVTIDFADINYNEIVEQALGEFEDKISAARLEIIPQFPDHPVMIRADGRHLWRVIENLLNNCCKYALRESRVYVDITEDRENGTAVCTIKNISSRPLNISPEELTERFVRGDVSRTTEGSGLGLSIAQSLTKLMEGQLVIEIDGDLYKASVVLHSASPEAQTASKKL